MTSIKKAVRTQHEKNSFISVIIFGPEWQRVNKEIQTGIFSKIDSRVFSPLYDFVKISIREGSFEK